MQAEFFGGKPSGMSVDSTEARDNLYEADLFAIKANSPQGGGTKPRVRPQGLMAGRPKERVVSLPWKSGLRDGSNGFGTFPLPVEILIAIAIGGFAFILLIVLIRFVLAILQN